MTQIGGSGQDLARAFVDLQDLQYGRLAVVVIVTWAVVFAVGRLVPWLGARVPSRMRFYVLPLAPVLRLLVLLIGILETTRLVVNPSLQNLLVLASVAGVALGFAFKDYVSSLLAGIIVLYEKPYRPGDWVQIGDTYGEVESLGLRAVRIVTPDDTVVTVPHARIWDSNIGNANDGKREHLGVADFYVHPSHDAALVRQKLWDVAIVSPYLHRERPVTVVVAERPWGSHYRVKAYPIDGRDQFAFTSDLTVRGKAALAAAGVQPALVPVTADRQG